MFFVEMGFSSFSLHGEKALFFVEYELEHLYVVFES